MSENLTFRLTASALISNKCLSSMEIKGFLAKLISLEFDKAKNETEWGQLQIL